MSRTKNTTRSIFWGFVNRIINILLPFIMRTIMIYEMGTLYLGLGSLFTSILSVLSLSELGFSSALVFSMYKPIADHEDDIVCALLNFYKKCYRIIGTIILILGLAILPFVKNFISGGYPKEINLYILYIIYLFSTVISYFLFAYKKSILIANQRNDIDSNINSIVTIIQYLIQIILLILFKNYYIYIIIMPIANIANNLITQYWSNKLFPQYFCKGKPSKLEIQSIKQKVEGIIFQKIGSVVLDSVDSIVISIFLGLKVLAIYGNYYYIISALFGILTVIMNALVPSVGNSIAQESMDKNYQDFIKFNFMYMWIVSWWSVCLLCLYQPFMKLWVGKELMLSVEMVLLFVLYFFVHKWCDMLYVYQESAGIWWETKFIPLIAAIVNLVINIVLVMYIGLPGILISTIISVVFVYNFGYARVIFKVYFYEHDGLLKYILSQLFYLMCTIVAAVVTYLICNMIVFEGIIGLVIKLIICIVIPNVVLILLYCKTLEFRQTKSFFIHAIKNR